MAKTTSQMRRIVKRVRLTNSGEQPGNRCTLLLDNDLVLAEDAGADALDDTDLGDLLLLNLAQTEGECAELLDNLGQKLPRRGTLELVRVGSAAVESGPVAVALDLATSQTETHLNTPDVADLGLAFTPDTLAGRKDDLLLGLDLVVLELPDGGALNDIASVGLGNLLNHLGHLALRVRLLGGSLLLLLLVALSNKARRDHQPEQKLIGVVCSEQEIGFLSSDLAGGADQDVVADNGAETVDLSAELNLDNLSSLECGCGLLGVGLEGSVWGDVSARRDGGAVTNALEHLFATVDLGDLFVEQLVAALAELDDAGALSDPSWKSQILSHTTAAGIGTTSAPVATHQRLP
jgi:hypothetical protein